jgi:predicted metal-dependent hydrolase
MQPSLPFEQPIVFARHARARRYVIRVQRDGTVRVTIPRWGSKREAAAFAAREQAWIDRQQQRLARAGLVVAPPAHDDEAPTSALRARARRELPARLLELAARYALTVTRISVRNQKSRWGSCSPSGHICVNWRLITMPEWVRDYVFIHELMHLKRMDHSPRFWKLVAEACPEYRAARAWLRTHVSA